MKNGIAVNKKGKGKKEQKCRQIETKQEKNTNGSKDI